MSNDRFLDVEMLRTFVRDVCIGLGIPTDDAKICSDVMIAADLRGIESHGVQRLKSYYYNPLKEGRQSPVTKISIVKETPTTARLDGGHGMGQVASYHAMKLAIKKAKEYGTGAVSVGNSTHFGIAGFYSLMSIQENMIGIAMTNTRSIVAPTHGIEQMMGTNPISIGCPTDENFPFLLDFATSIVPQGKIELFARAKKAIPEGWAIDEKGHISTDSEKILKGIFSGKAALLPIGGIGELMGGHKGYGLSVVVEILSAALWGGPFMKDLMDDKGHQLGHFFLAIDPESFIELDTFKRVAGEICRTLRASKKAPGQNHIYTAGEKEYNTENERQKTGIPISESVLQEFVFMNSDLGLNYQFEV